MPFDFRYNEASGSIEKRGHYSRSEAREATREEALLWRRVVELEALLDERCPEEVKSLLEQFSKLPSETLKIEVSPKDFAALRAFAPHRIRMADDPNLTKDRVLGYIPILVEGSPSSIWIAVSPSVPPGTVRTGCVR